MTKKLYELKNGEEGNFLSCDDCSVKNDLRAYGFISDVTVRVVSKNKGGVVVEVLDTLYSINRFLATKINVKVVKN